MMAIAWGLILGSLGYQMKPTGCIECALGMGVAGWFIGSLMD